MSNLSDLVPNEKMKIYLTWEAFAPPDPPFLVGLWPPKIDILENSIDFVIYFREYPLSEARGRPGMGGLGGRMAPQ